MARHRPNPTTSHPPRVPLELVLSAEVLHHEATSAVFFAVIIDMNGRAIRRIPFYRAMPGEAVFLSVERQSIFNDGRTGPNPVVPT